MEPKVFVVIPARNEARRLPLVLRQTMDEGFGNIVVVDDGSDDATTPIARSFGIAVIRHPINLGVGAATQTGIEYALEKGADIIVTLDGDNQHFPADIKILVDALQESGVDAVVGSRFLNKTNYIPVSRRIYNVLANLLTAFFTGLWVSDSQSGMKAFRASFARKVHFYFNGYEFCTEFFLILRHYKSSFKEVPIRVAYNREVMLKGQSLANGFRMIGEFFRHFIH